MFELYVSSLIRLHGVVQSLLLFQLSEKGAKIVMAHYLFFKEIFYH
jgi:hypothetical protein